MLKKEGIAEPENIPSVFLTPTPVAAEEKVGAEAGDPPLPRSMRAPAGAATVVDFELQQRVLELIKPHGIRGVSLTTLDADYLHAHGHHAPQPIASLLPPKGFIPGVRYMRLDGSTGAGRGIVFTFSQALADGVENKLAREEGRPTTNRATVPEVIEDGIEEEVGDALSGQLCATPGGGKAFDVQLTGLTIRNAHALSLLIRGSLRYIICKDRKVHRPRALCTSRAVPSLPAAHLVLLNASLLMQPKEGCVLWYTSGKSPDVVDVVEHMEPTWAGYSPEAKNLEGHALMTFTSNNKPKWDVNVKNVWVLLSLPGRRLVTLKDGRLLLLGGFLKACMHVGASNGPWHLSGARAREKEVLQESLACCRRGGILPPLDRSDRSLYVDQSKTIDKGKPSAAKKAPAAAASSSAPPRKAGSGGFAGLADESSSDEDEDE